MNYFKHLPSCSLNQNWQEAIDAMSDTPNEYRDGEYYMALEEIETKRKTCTCGLDKIISASIAGATEAQDDWKRVEELEKALDQIKNLIIIHELQMGSVHRKNVLDIIKRNLPTLKR